MWRIVGGMVISFSFCSPKTQLRSSCLCLYASLDSWIICCGDTLTMEYVKLSGHHLAKTLYGTEVESTIDAKDPFLTKLWVVKATPKCKTLV